MRFTAVLRSFMLSGVAVDAGNAALGAWLRLQSYAASDGVETARLAGARSWNERRWLLCCHISTSDVDEVVAANLAHWSDEDLVLEGFDEEGVAGVQKKRAQGHHGIEGKRKAPPLGSPKGKAKATPKATPKVGPLSSPSLSSPSPTKHSRTGSSSELLAHSEPTAFTFPVVGSGSETWNVTEQHHAELVKAFPGVYVGAEYPKALAWLNANTLKRKTAKGMRKFLFGWMERAQNGARLPANGSNGDLELAASRLVGGGTS